jgi:hypothetical protein
MENERLPISHLPFPIRHCPFPISRFPLTVSSQLVIAYTTMFTANFVLSSR